VTPLAIRGGRAFRPRLFEGVSAPPNSPRGLLGAGPTCDTLEKVQPSPKETLRSLWSLTRAVLSDSDIWAAVERLTETIVIAGGNPARDDIWNALDDLPFVSADYARSRGFPYSDDDPLPPGIPLPPPRPSLSPAAQRRRQAMLAAAPPRRNERGQRG